MRSLQARMFIVFALIATLPVMALSYLALAEARTALSHEVGGAHLDAANAAAGFVYVYLENGRALLNATVFSPSLASAVSTGEASAVAQEVRGLRERSLYGAEPIYRSVVFLDRDGRVLAASPPEAAEVGEDRASSPAYFVPRAQGRLSVMPVPGEGLPVLPVAAPVYVNGTFRGVLVAELSLSTLARGLQAFAPAPSQSIFVTDHAGRLLGHPDEGVLWTRPDWASVAPVARAVAGEEGFLEYDEPGTGVLSLASYARVPVLGWVVVNSVPVSVAYAGLTRLTAVLVVFSGILVGTILLASVVMARRIVKPVRELTLAASTLSAGNLGTRIDPRGGDEIGELGRAFNEMADRIGESLDGLRRSEARYRNLVESANDFIFTVQPDGTVSFASPHVLPLLGYESQALMGQPAHVHVHEGDRLHFMETVRRVLETGEPVLWVPFRFVTRAGTARSVLANFSPIFEDGARPARVLAVAHDVTLEKRQELIRDKAFQMARLVSDQGALEPLANRALALLLAVASLTRGAVYIQREGALRETATANLQDFDSGSRVLLARLAGQAVARAGPVSQPVHDEEVLALPLLERGEALGAVVLAGRRNDLSGENLEVLQALSSQLAVGIRRTLFEERLRGYAAELETRVEERTAELQEKSREMESFLYSVSHDLKAPLISIQGYAQGLQEDYGALLEGDGALFLERIRKNASLMESLILDILELSRIGRVREGAADVDMERLVAEVASRVRGRYHQEGRVLIHGPLPAVRGEPRRLDQLFSNLLDNAFKYRHPERAPVVEIRGALEGAEAVFHVADNGRGIPVQARDKVFDIFQRAPAAGLEDPGGTGMGLAIVRRIVETHGGTIALESEEGKGTTFHVRLPAAGGGA